MGIRIVLADDHQLMRSGLRALIEQQGDMEVMAEAENGRQAVQLIVEKCPDIAIMDIGMPELNGIEATRRIAIEQPMTKVIALSMHSDKRYVEGMLSAGASGYLLKDSAFEEVVRAIRSVTNNQIYLSPSISNIVVEGFVRSKSAKGSELTPREREALQLLAEGHTTKEIAAKLEVSSKTIETYRQHIMDKLELRSVAELTKYAIRAGLTSLDD